MTILAGLAPRSTEVQPLLRYYYRDVRSNAQICSTTCFSGTAGALTGYCQSHRINEGLHDYLIIAIPVPVFSAVRFLLPCQLSIQVLDSAFEQLTVVGVQDPATFTDPTRHISWLHESYAVVLSPSTDMSTIAEAGDHRHRESSDFYDCKCVEVSLV